jgi:hypothetical protein
MNINIDLTTTFYSLSEIIQTSIFPITNPAIMMTADERKLMKSSHRQLEEIIKDPTAKWDDIRKAMKAHGTGACTNAALVRALSSRVGSASRLSGRDVPPPAARTAASPSPSNTDKLTNSTSKLSDDPGEDLGASNQEGNWIDCETHYIPTFQVPLASTDTGVEKSRKLAVRRGSLSSLASTTPSVNLMDFGVDHFAELDSDSSTARDELVSRTSFVSNYSCETDGFMGWKRNDSKSSLSDATNLSMYCDEEGFLTWDVSASARVAAAEAEKIATELASPNSEYSKEERRKSWHIEDYEGNEGFNESTATLASTNSKTSNFLSSLRGLSRDKADQIYSDFSNSDPFWKKYTPVSTSKTSQENPKHATTELDNDVRKALLNLRRSNHDRDETEEQTDNQPKEPLPTKLSSLQTLFNGLSVEGNKSNPRKGKERRRSTIDLPLPLEDETPKQSVCPSSFHASDDKRKAIWINRSDGDVDIDKECRKLYLEPEDQQQQKPPPRRQRTSFFGGEIPKVFKRNENSDED